MGRFLNRTAIGLPVIWSVWFLVSSGQSAGIEPAGHETALKPPRSTVNQASASTALLQVQTHKYVGVASCAAANCHGGGGGKIQGSEYSLWMQIDPHSRSFTILYNELSSQMIERLKKSATYQHLQAAPQEQICLSCHAVAPDQSQLADGHRFAVHDGVGCEACHGPAEKWLDAHKRRDWQQRSPQQKADLGFWNTKNILTRARVCAVCHVGAPGRDVNHDLIAAGHPRLNFELSAYNAIMPSHWNRNDDRRRNALGSATAKPTDIRSYFEAKLWSIGQIVTAETAVDLLEWRATDRKAIWPEFAEYGCFACHHDLAAPSWRQKRGYAGRRAGEMPWGTWHFPLLPALSKELSGIDFAGNGSVFPKLQREMAKPYPDRDTVAQHAAAIKSQLAQWADQLNRDQLSAKTQKALLTRFVTDGQTLSSREWDAAAQVYLAATALHQAYADSRGRIGPTLSDQEERIEVLLESIREQLRFPRENVGEANTARFDSPKTFVPDRVQAINEQLGRIQKIVESK